MRKTLKVAFALSGDPAYSLAANVELKGVAGLGLGLHLDKTSIGPIARGFDGPGYRHDRTGLRLSAAILKRHQEKLTWLYERNQRRLRMHRRQLVGQSTIPRLDPDPARAYLNPQPQITSHNDIVQRLEAHNKRFAA